MIDEKSYQLNPRQELFCQLYTTDKEFFGNGVQSYLESYKPRKISPNWYRNACSEASQLLSNNRVLTRINQLLEANGLNDSFVDKQLQFLITQNTDFQSKLGAIREYNKIKSRISNKLDLTSGGLPIPILSGIKTND